MPKLTIDGRPVEVPEGTTLLQAAAKLGIHVPTLCTLDGFEPDPSCFVCVVQVEGRPNLTPSCATVAADGMVVRTDTDDVLTARRMALELMLSDHTGDCAAPCTLACPAHLDVADFIAAIGRADHRAAIQIIKRRIALPASLGRVCPRFCENVCRRKLLDEPVAICSLRRFAADLDLASADPFVPQRAPASGRRVAIVGAGPAGLAAAYYLLQDGHACTLIEARDEPGGMFHYGIADWRLPNKILHAEIDVVRQLGADIRTATRLGADVSLDELARDADAVLLALGAQTAAGAADSFSPRGHTRTGGEFDPAFLRALGLDVAARGLKVDRATLQTTRPGVFAAGNVVSGPNYGVHAVAGGRRAAVAINQLLNAVPVVGEPRPVNVTMRDLTDAETQRFIAGAEPARRVLLDDDGPDAAPRGLTEAEARDEAHRCLQCDCAKRRHCALRQYAEAAGASPTRFRGERRPFQRDVTHPDVVFESGKCIQCGRCVRIAEAAREQLGLTFVGRGFTVKTATPFAESLQAGLRTTAHRCAEACPTGAISLRHAEREEDAT